MDKEIMQIKEDLSANIQSTKSAHNKLSKEIRTISFSFICTKIDKIDNLWYN